MHDVRDLEDGGLLKALAGCHSLSVFEGALTGDPLDIKMFESTKWTFMDDHGQNASSNFENSAPIVKQLRHGLETGLQMAIVKQFTFSSSMLRMSVICKSSDQSHFEVFTKGAPEKILELCKPHSSIKK